MRLKFKPGMKYKARLLFLFCLLMACMNIAQAQQPADQVVLKLKNGSILKGTLLRQSEGMYELQVGNAARMNIPVDYVEEILPDIPPRRKGYALIQSGLFFGQRTQGHLETLQVAPSLQLSAGYAYRYWLQAGLGTGLEQYGKITVFPVFAELRGNVLDRMFSPYYNVKIGAGFAEVKNDFRYQEAKGGLMTEFQAGLNIDFKGFSWQLGTGFHQQKVTLEGTSPSWGWIGWEDSRRQYRNLRRLMMTTSFRFSF